MIYCPGCGRIRIENVVHDSGRMYIWGLPVKPPRARKLRGRHPVQYDILDTAEELTCVICRSKLEKAEEILENMPDDLRESARQVKDLLMTVPPEARKAAVQRVAKMLGIKAPE